MDPALALVLGTTNWNWANITMTLDSSGLVKGHKLHERTRPLELRTGEWSVFPVIRKTSQNSWRFIPGILWGPGPAVRAPAANTVLLGDGKNHLDLLHREHNGSKLGAGILLENSSEILAVFSVQHWGCREGFLWLLPHDWATVAASSLTYMPHWPRTQAP